MHAGAVDWERVVSFTFLLTHLAGAAVGLGARGEVGASDGMVAVVMSRVSVLSSPGLFIGGKEGS